MKFCRCGREASWYCSLHDIYFCRRCGEQDGYYEPHKQYRKPIGHFTPGGSRTEIIPNLWLGDFLDAEEIGDDPNWKIFAIADYPELEIPREPKSATVTYIFLNREELADAGKDVGYGSEWHEDPDLRVDIHTLSILACNIHNALRDGYKVLVHCVGGIHRSPLVVAWYLYVFNDGLQPRDYDNYTVEDAYDLICSKRKEVQRRTYWLPNDVRERMFKPRFTDDGEWADSR